MKPTSVRVFAPATVANFGPGFDVLGLAVDGLGDHVAASRIDGEPGCELVDITGDGGRLPRSPELNTASVAAASVAKRLGIRVALTLEKGLPLASGMGSSAASSVAGAFAAAVLGGFGAEDDKAILLGDTLAGEKVASGAAHADNVGPSLMGGAILIDSPHADPPLFSRLPIPERLWLSLAMPKLELKTSEARAALPNSIALNSAVTAWARLSGLVAAFYRSDLRLLGRCLVDDIVEPVRGRLINGFEAVKAAALETGALACSISGAGPTLFAVSDSQSCADSVAKAMTNAWANVGVDAAAHVCRPDLRGARVVS